MRSPWRIGDSGNVGGPKDANRTWGPEESRRQVVKMGICPRRGGLQDHSALGHRTSNCPTFLITERSCITVFVYTCVKQGKRWSYLSVIEVGIRYESTCKKYF